MLPDYHGKGRGEVKRQVELAATRPYLRTQFEIIVTPQFQRQVSSIDDLEGIAPMVEIQSLPAIILWQHKDGLLMSNITHIAPTKGLLNQLETGGAVATLMEVHRFDHYRFRNPTTKLRWSGYTHPIGYNFGFAGLAGASDLIASVNEVLTRFADSATLADIAKRNALTYFAPAKPYVAGKLTIE
ncbi:MAG: transporter substrate-binding domain-containing protein [Gammaproteobacteria bacterium]|nr:transporter substrate-binding domain-containing protein [Gammaproteobacteria bacterium]